MFQDFDRRKTRTGEDAGSGSENLATSSKILNGEVNAQLPTLAVKTSLSCSPYSDQSLTGERDSPFPIELRSLQAGSHFWRNGERLPAWKLIPDSADFRNSCGAQTEGTTLRSIGLKAFLRYKARRPVLTGLPEPVMRPLV